MPNTDKTPCECSKFEAQDPEQLTEENLSSGDYESWDTGCQAETSRTFAPGHDAKLKSALIKWGSQGLDVCRLEGGVRSVSDAESWANKYEFGHMVRAGLAKAAEKAQAKADRAAARAAKSAERKLAKSAGLVASADTEHDGNSARREREARSLAEIAQAEDQAHRADEAAKVAEREATADWSDDQPATVTAKIGRWEYSGVVGDNGAFWYTDKKGRQKMAKDGEYKVV